MRKTMPFWIDRDYGYKIPNEYDQTEKTIEDMAWRIEYLTEQWLDLARIKQICLRGYRLEECEAERGGQDCRDCLAMMGATWEPIAFD